MQDASAKQSDDAPSRVPEPVLQFGPFHLHRARKQLFEGGRPVQLGSRAFELLTALVERAGEVLSREELEARVWPRTVVEETSLRVHISALRKALGDGRDGARYITNVPGRGYCLMLPEAPTPSQPAENQARSATAHQAALHNLPARLTRAIGRSEVTAALGMQLVRRRLVSIVGAGGMGKTTVALAVAEERLGTYEHGAWFVDLASQSDPALVPGALGSVLGLSVPAGNPWPALCAYLRDSRLLVVLDNCEHVIDAAAMLVEEILRAAPGVHVLATSREPLDAEGEWVHRLPALQMPSVADTLDADQALAFPAIALFVERATANAHSFVLSQANLPLVRALCRQLDGMPLAIELAAARVDSLGLQGLAARLNDLFRLLTRGRRTALPRHRTLQALIDWSHDLLREAERAVLRRLAVFRAGFTLEAAARVACCEALAPAAVVECVLSLCAKSLVVMEGDGEAAQHRLLFTTRTYAMEKLVASGEKEQLARRHAAYFLALLEDASGPREVVPITQWLAAYAWAMDDVRAGLDWAFSPAGDLLLGVRLTVAAIHLVFELGLNDEYRGRIDLALDAVRGLSPPQPELELRLCAALLFIVGVTVAHVDPPGWTYARTAELAEQLGSRRHKVEAMFSLCVSSFGRGDYPVVAQLAQRIAAMASGPSDPLAVLLSDRFLALSRHYLGDLRGGRQLAMRVLQYPSGQSHRQYLGWNPRGVTMRILLSRTLWLQGRCDQAVEVAQECMENAEGAHPLALSQAIASAAAAVALWRGDNSWARELADRLFTHAARHSQSSWQSWARNYQNVLAMRLHMPAAVDWALPANAMELDMLGTLAETMVSPLSLARVESGTVGWCAPEILRAHGENLLAQGDTNAQPAAQVLFERSLRLAREQGALSWELRTAASLARLWSSHGRREEAHALLASTYGRFTEGFGTADLRSARQLLDALKTPGRSHDV